MPPRLPPRLPVAVGYVRASTDEQPETLLAQRQVLVDFCRTRKVTLGEVFVDEDVSGGVPLDERPQGKQLVQLVDSRQVNAVVATRLDRLFRSTIDCLVTTDAWHSTGVALMLGDVGGGSVDTSTAIGRLMLTIIAGVTEYERGVISERTTAVLENKRKRGHATNHAPYGYTIRRVGEGEDAISYLDPCPREQRVLSLITELAAGGMSIRAIVKHLTDAGERARGPSGEWHVTTIARLLKREKTTEGAT
jgi:site-specific DNA recombinase